MSESKGGHANKEDKRPLSLIEFENFLFNPFFLYSVTKEMDFNYSHHLGYSRFMIQLKIAGEEQPRTFTYKTENLRDRKYEGLKSAISVATKIKVTTVEDYVQQLTQDDKNEEDQF